jgi:hypothetical protein
MNEEDPDEDVGQTLSFPRRCGLRKYNIYVFGIILLTIGMHVPVYIIVNMSIIFE